MIGPTGGAKRYDGVLPDRGRMLTPRRSRALRRLLNSPAWFALTALSLAYTGYMAVVEIARDEPIHAVLFVAVLVVIGVNMLDPD